MQSQVQSAHNWEKQRLRSELDDHIREFLNRGGKIDILHCNSKQSRSSGCSSWQTQDDVSEYMD